MHASARERPDLLFDPKATNFQRSNRSAHVLFISERLPWWPSGSERDADGTVTNMMK